MATKIYGASDDLVIAEGDVSGEVSRFNTDELSPVVLVCSDGTILQIIYGKRVGKNDIGVWSMKVVKVGKLLVNVAECFDEEASPYSDVAVFESGLEWVMCITGDNIEFEELK